MLAELVGELVGEWFSVLMWGVGVFTGYCIAMGRVLRKKGQYYKGAIQALDDAMVVMQEARKMHMQAREMLPTKLTGNEMRRVK